MIDIDARVKFFIVLVASLSIFFIQLHTSNILFAFAIGYLVLLGYYSQAIKFIIVYALVVLITYFTSSVSNDLLHVFSSFAYTLLRFVPLLALALPLLKIPTSKLLFSMQKIKLPRFMIIIIVITTRYIEDLKSEYQIIKDMGKIRKVGFNRFENWLKPIQTIEYMIIPLIFRSLKIADELSISALARGIDYPHLRTSHYVIRLKAYDYLIVCVFMSLFIYVVTYKG